MGEGSKSQQLKSLKVNLEIVKWNGSFQQQSKSSKANIFKDAKAKKSAHYELYPTKNQEDILAIKDKRKTSERKKKTPPPIPTPQQLAQE